MSQLPDSALPTSLADVKDSLVGQKLRVAGRLLSYDAITSTIIIVDGTIGLLVDVSSCLDSWVRERLGTVMVIGDLQRNEDQAPAPEVSRTSVDTRLVLRAIHVGNCGGIIDLEEWNSGIAALQSATVAEQSRNA
ncbi:hypothetical protein CPB85DRAFT_1429242 [Mucidula mucida]|nr:hypothetical protein CPB85DRAFT_1429242 [Mucidula mucida]